MKSLFYKSLKVYCKIALQVYFRRWQIHYLSPIPTGAVIFIANHQNAFLDAVLIACSTSRNPWAFARANVFEKPWAATILNLLKMMPIYRFRDGFATLRRNEEMISRAANLLTTGEALLIFPEGNHGERWALRPLQKGFVRMALAARSKMKPPEPLHIVPVGIQYESHHHFRSRVLVTFGAPVAVSPQAEEETILRDCSQKLESLILHIEGNYEAKVDHLKKNRICHVDLLQQLRADRDVINDYQNNATAIVGASPLKLKNKFPWINPLFIYGFVNHLPALISLRWILRNKVSDNQFTGSVKFAAGMVIVPVTYAIQSAIVFAISHSYFLTLSYLISLPFMGILSHFFFVKRNTQRS